MSYRLEIAISARMDIAENTRWLQGGTSDQAASRWVAGVLRSIRTLADLPLRHPIAEESEKFVEEIRQLLHGKGANRFRILFAIRGTTVVVLYVRHVALDVLEP